MGIANYTYNRSTSGGEIITHLINASDSQGLHFDGAAGSIDFTPPDLGTKFSFEFIVQADEWKTTGSQHFLCDFREATGDNDRVIFGSRGSSVTGELGVYSYTGASGGWNSFTGNPKVLDDLKVHHLVVTIDGTAAILYDNGNQVGTATLAVAPIINNATAAAIASSYDGGAHWFNGTIYRARFWNKTLSQAEVTASYENATVPFADQYGAQTELIAAQVDRDFSGANSWVNVDLDSFDSTGDLTVSSTAGAQECRLPEANAPMVGGLSYRVVVTASALSGDGFTIRDFDNVVMAKSGTLYRNGTYVEDSTLQLADGANVFEFVYAGALGESNGGLMVRSDGTGGITCDDFSVREIGCVADYDLAFAQPALSTLIQDRSNAADGVASSTGVTQVTPITQLNSTSARIGSTQLAAGTAPYIPADGELLADSVKVNPTASGSGEVAIDSASAYEAKVVFAEGGSNKWAIGNDGDGGDAFVVSAAGNLSTPKLTISSAGLATFSSGIVSSAMPTSDPAVAGQLWNDSGTVKISSG